MDSQIIAGFILLGLIAFVYFIPTFVALSRHHKNLPAIVLLNIFGGWTVLGWVAALVWSASYQGEIA